MNRTTSLLVLAFASVCLPTALTAQDARTEKALLRACAEWLGNWKGGKVDLTGADLLLGKGKSDKDFPSVKYGLQPERVIEANTYSQRSEIEWIAKQLAEMGTAEAAEQLLDVASAGFDGRSYDIERGAETVRTIGDAALQSMTGSAGRTYALAVASGDEKAKAPVQAAALRAVGAWGGSDAVTALVAALDDKSDVVRMTAVEGLGRAKSPDAIEPIASLIVREKETNVLIAAIDALTAILDALGKDVDGNALRHAATAVVDRFNEVDWRVDYGAVKFFKRARVREAVPALIELLARYVEDEDAVKKGELTGTLRWDAAQVLRDLTGANFPPEQPNLWRDWWERNGASFKVQEKAEDTEVKTKAGFFGIPVRGNRVLFIIDNSGSMSWNTVEPGKDGKKRSGLELAKRELLGVVQQLGPDDRFNVVRFSNGPDAWQKGLVEASDRNKERFTKWVEDIRADGGTNLWAALQTGLELKSLAHGERFAAEVDEVFILSDGEPSAGEIVDPRRITDVLREVNGFSKLRINTIFIEVALPPELKGRVLEPPFEMKGAELMETIAEQNDGRFLRVTG
jgi:HEAT repeat protein